MDSVGGYKAPDFFKTASPDRYELLKAFARENRNHATEAEKVLWSFVKGQVLGPRFLRQHIIKDYIADFVALEAHLVIEVDGGYHATSEQMDWDAYRTEELEKLGFKVIRFKNEEILFEPEKVLDRIIYELNHVERSRIIG